MTVLLKILQILFVLWAVLCSSFVQAQLIIICHAKVEKNTLSHKEFSEIYLGKQKRWTDQTRIILVVMEKSAIHRSFVETYTAKTPIQFKNWWNLQLFSGKGLLPISLDTEKAVIDFVAKTEGAVGYISSPPPKDASVTVLTITDSERTKAEP